MGTTPDHAASRKKSKEICVKLFGFKIHVLEKQQELPTSSSSSMMRKSKSTPNLVACNKDHDVEEGYLSDHVPEAHGKKRGMPWTENEHLSFLSGLEKLEKGDWKAISRNYVHSRTATQVASHAQKYFKRLSLTNKRNQRTSLLDMSLNEPEIKTSPSPEPPDINNDEIPTLVGCFPVLNMNQDCETEEQGSTLPPVLPYTPCYGVRNFSQMPYFPMMGMTNNTQLFVASKSFVNMPSIPIMYIPNPAYFYAPNCPRSQASNPFFMATFPHGFSSLMARH